MRHIKIIPIMFFICISLSCDKDSPNEPEVERTGDLEGKVYKSGTEVPVQGARVSVDNIVSTTDEYGSYKLTDIPVGRKVLKVERSNYETYEETIDIRERTQTKDIYLISHIKQHLYGKVLNKQNNPVPNALVTIDEDTKETNINGEYEFPDLVEGDYIINIESDGYEEYEKEFTMPEGEKELNIHLNAELLEQVSNTTLSNVSGGIQVNWSDIDSSVLEGYNIYYKYYHWWDFHAELIKPQDVFKPVYSSWKRANTQPITQSEYKILAEDYNAGYGIYVLPVNIDGVETSYSDDETRVRYLHLDCNFNELSRFGLTNMHGPVEIPNNNNEMSLMMYFEFDEGIAALYEPNNWKTQISLDRNSWSILGSNGMDMYGSFIPALGGGYIKHFSLNEYKGESVYFRTDPSDDNNVPIKFINAIREYIK